MGPRAGESPSGGFVEVSLDPKSPLTGGAPTGGHAGAQTVAEEEMAAVPLDAALQEHVGEMGFGQWVTLTAASLSWISLACAALSMVFFSADPVRSKSWRCIDPSDSQCAAALAAAPTDGAPFCALPRGRYAFDPPRLSAVAEFGLVCDEAWRAAIGNSAYFWGIWLGSTPFGWLSDRRGRRACLVASGIATATLCALWSALAPGFWAYVIGRAFVGFAAAGLPIGAYLLSTECVGPARRGAAGLISQLIYHPGEWILPVLAAALLDWRHLNIALAAICAAGAAAAAAVPESPRWLLAQGRHREAEEATNWLARLNRTRLPPGLRLRVGDAGDGGDSDSEGMRQLKGRQGEEQGPQQREAEADWRLLFRHPLLRRSLLVSSGLQTVCAIVFFTAGLASDALQGYSVERAFLVTSLFEVPAYILGVAAIDTIGRRATVFSFMLLSGVSSLACAFSAPGPLQVVFATINRGVISAAWGSAYIVTAETSTTPLRSQALGLSNQAARIGGVVAPIIPYLAVRLGMPALPFAVMGVLSLAASAAVLLLPETRGRPQADTIEQLESLYYTKTAAGGSGLGSSGKGAAGSGSGSGGGGKAAYRRLPLEDDEEEGSSFGRGSRHALQKAGPLGGAGAAGAAAATGGICDVRGAPPGGRDQGAVTGLQAAAGPPPAGPDAPWLLRAASGVATGSVATWGSFSSSAWGDPPEMSGCLDDSSGPEGAGGGREGSGFGPSFRAPGAAGRGLLLPPLLPPPPVASAAGAARGTPACVEMGLRGSGQVEEP